MKTNLQNNKSYTNYVWLSIKLNRVAFINALNLLILPSIASNDSQGDSEKQGKGLFSKLTLCLPNGK